MAMQSDDGVISSARSNAAAGVSQDFLRIEYEQIERSLVVYEVVGRILSVVILLADVFLEHTVMRATISTLMIAALTTFWMARAETLRKRRQTMSKAIAESAYLEDREWGTLYIRRYQDRYAWPVGLSAVISAEPIIWLALSIAVLGWVIR
jgi:hypothetical protein